MGSIMTIPPDAVTNKQCDHVVECSESKASRDFASKTISHQVTRLSFHNSPLWTILTWFCLTGNSCFLDPLPTSSGLSSWDPTQNWSTKSIQLRSDSCSVLADALPTCYFIVWGNLLTDCGQGIVWCDWSVARHGTCLKVSTIRASGRLSFI